MARIDEFTDLFEQFRTLVLGRLQEGDEAARRLAQQGQQFDRERADLQGEISQLKEVVDEQAATITAVKAIEKDRQLLEKRCTALTEQCAGLKQELTHLQGENSQLQQVVNEQAVAITATKAIEKDRQLLDEQRAALKKELQTLHAHHGELLAQVEQERAQFSQQLVDWDAWEKGTARRLEKLQQTNQELERRLLESQRQLAEASRAQAPAAAAASSAETVSDSKEQARRPVESERRVAELVRQRLSARATAGAADPARPAPDKPQLPQRPVEPQPLFTATPRQKTPAAATGRSEPAKTPPQRASRPVESERAVAGPLHQKTVNPTATVATGPPKTAGDSRRIATPCLVVIHRSVNDEVKGWAVERSLEGLVLLVDEKYAPGTPLKVRSEKSTQASWIDIVVQECYPERVNFKLKCSFASPVTWADILHLAG
jgi:hypothetical protein